MVMQFFEMTVATSRSQVCTHKGESHNARPRSLASSLTRRRVEWDVHVWKAAFACRQANRAARGHCLVWQWSDLGLSRLVVGGYQAGILQYKKIRRVGNILNRRSLSFAYNSSLRNGPPLSAPRIPGGGFFRFRWFLELHNSTLCAE